MESRGVYCAQIRSCHRVRRGLVQAPHKFFVLRFLSSKYLKTKCLRSIHAANALKTEYLPKTPGGEGVRTGNPTPRPRRKREKPIVRPCPLTTDPFFSNPFVMKCLQQNFGKNRKIRP